MKLPESIINSIDQYTKNITKSFAEMMKSTQIEIANEAYTMGKADGYKALDDALMYISKWSIEKKSSYFKGCLGLENILKNHDARYIIRSAMEEQKKTAESAVKEKDEMDDRISDDLKALCARRGVPLTQVADVMQKMFDAGV